jgi:G:T-mismatch repair DNA endonuclease (very short patch repair protein)
MTRRKKRQRRKHRKRRRRKAKVKSSFYNTYPEQIVARMLRELRIPFYSQYPIFGTPDFFVPPRTAIFVDGDYWHSFPSVRQHDRFVSSYLRKHGVKVIRIKERDVYKKPNKIRSILKKIKF